MMKFVCYSESCSTEVECCCDSPCCAGVYYEPKYMEIIDDHHIKILGNPDKIIEIDDTDLTSNLVIGHECPFCCSRVEA